MRHFVSDFQEFLYRGDGSVLFGYYQKYVGVRPVFLLFDRQARIRQRNRGRANQFRQCCGDIHRGQSDFLSSDCIRFLESTNSRQDSGDEGFWWIFFFVFDQWEGSELLRDLTEKDYFSYL